MADSKPPFGSKSEGSAAAKNDLVKDGSGGGNSKGVDLLKTGRASEGGKPPYDPATDFEPSTDKTDPSVNKETIPKGGLLPFKGEPQATENGNKLPVKGLR